MESFLAIGAKYPSYEPFCNDVAKHRDWLVLMESELASIMPFSNSLIKFSEFGDLLKCYYSYIQSLNMKMLLDMQLDLKDTLII